MRYKVVSTKVLYSLLSHGDEFEECTWRMWLKVVTFTEATVDAQIFCTVWIGCLWEFL